MAVIFDLDQTLVDSRLVTPLRQSRNRRAVYAMIGQVQPYAGISELIEELNQRNVPVCIVTSSLKYFCDRIITDQNWQIAATVCYHDTPVHKPHPAPILLALSRLGLPSAGVVAVGDSAKDTHAAKAAGVFSIGALWGSLERQQLIASNPDLLCETVSDIIALLS